MADLNQMAARVVREATDQDAPERSPETPNQEAGNEDRPKASRGEEARKSAE
jgi:hypothetical protein